MGAKDLISPCEDVLAMLAAAESHLRVLSAAHLEFPDVMAMHREAIQRARLHLEDAGLHIAVIGLTDVVDDDTDELLHRAVRDMSSSATPSPARKRRRLFGAARVLVADGEDGPLLGLGEAAMIPLDDGPEGSADRTAALSTEEEPIVSEEYVDEIEVEDLEVLSEDDEVPGEALATQEVPRPAPPLPPRASADEEIPEDEFDLFADDVPARGGGLPQLEDPATNKEEAGPLVAFDDATLSEDIGDSLLLDLDGEDEGDEASEDDDAFVEFADDDAPLAQVAAAPADPGLVQFDEPASGLVDFEPDDDDDDDDDAAEDDDETTLVLDGAAAVKMASEALAEAVAAASRKRKTDEDTEDPDTEESATPAQPAPVTSPSASVGVRVGPAPTAAASVGVKTAAKPIAPRVRGERRDAAASLYAASASVPKIRDSSGPKPRSAAIQLNPSAPGAAEMTGTVLGEEEEEIAIGGAEDYGEDEIDVEADLGSGFRLQVEEYDDDEEEDDEEDEEDEEDQDASAAPPPPPEDTGPSAADIKAMLQKARAAAERGDHEAGVNLFSDVLDADPDSLDACIGRGRLYLVLGDYARAMSDFTVAEDLAPESPEPQVATGDLYFERKEYRRAIEHFNAALEMSPNHAMAYCRRGISHYYRKNYSEALDDLTKAQKLDPEIPNIRTYVSMAKKKKK